RYGIGFVEGGAPALRQEMERQKDNPHPGGLEVAGARALSGRIAEARQFGFGAGFPAGGPTGPFALEFVQAWFGMPVSAGKVLKRIQIPRTSLDQPAAGEALLVLALLGESKPVDMMIDEMKKESPNDTLQNSVWIPTAKALSEIRLGHGESAVELLRAARPYEPGPASLY